MPVPNGTGLTRSVVPTLQARLDDGSSLTLFAECDGSSVTLGPWELFVSRNLLATLLSIAVLAATPGSARGQDAQAKADVQFTAEQMSELKKWLSDNAKWEKWNKRWGNTVLPHPVRHRPAAPAWLEEECSQLIGGEGLLVQACSHLKDISEDRNTAAIRQATAAQRKQQEGFKTRFIERVHVGAGWPLMQVGGFTYGALLESHVSITNLGRIEINLPGIMILSVPDENGHRVVKFGTDLTLSFRLGEFQVPGIKQRYVLHMNIANAWTGVGSPAFGFDSRASLIGLSVTIKNSH